MSESPNNNNGQPTPADECDKFVVPKRREATMLAKSLDGAEWRILRLINETSDDGPYVIGSDEHISESGSGPVWSVMSIDSIIEGNSWENPVAWGFTAKEAIVRAAYKLGVLCSHDEID